MSAANQNLEIEHGGRDVPKSSCPLPHPKHYADLFDFIDYIDLTGVFAYQLDDINVE